jgi:uncharacterized protein (TIGR03546 family)
MFGLEIIAKIFKILRSGGSPGQIAAGFTLGMVPGLTPPWNLHNLIILILLIILNVNLGAAIFSFIIFSGIAYIFDPWFHDLGYYLLTGIPALKEMWTTLYHMPVFGLSNFNNTVVMGSLITSLVLLIPIYFLIKKFIVLYREKLEARFLKLKIVQLVRGSRIYSFYEKIKNLGG